MPDRLQTLLEAVYKTYEIDDSGDATLYGYLEEYRTGNVAHYRALPEYRELPTDTIGLLEGFLIWANGTRWEQFLKTAEIGDIPPKE